MFKLNSLLQSHFARNVSLLAGGTAIAQALAIVILPILTRIYSPADFSVLAVFSALLGLVSVVSGLRYEIAIPLPKSDLIAANLLAIALFFVAATTVVAAILVLLFKVQIASWMNNPELSQYLWLLPIAIVTSGAYSVFQYWATRKQAFGRIARTRVEQSIGGASVQLLLGWSGIGALGLIIGQIVSAGAGFWGLARRAFKEDSQAFRGIHKTKMKLAAREYDRFPKYSALEALTNSAAFQVPMILIASLSVSHEVGYLMLALRVTQAPMGLIGSSISQVYFSNAVEEHRAGRLGAFTSRMIGRLAVIGVGPLIFAGIVSPVIFGPIFGAVWHRAGEIIAYMTPWFLFQFLVSPVSMALHVTNNQRAALIFQVAGLLIRIVMVIIGGHILDGKYLTEMFAFSGFIFYFAYLWLVCEVADIGPNKLLNDLRSSAPVICAWGLFAVVIRVLL